MNMKKISRFRFLIRIEFIREKEKRLLRVSLFITALTNINGKRMTFSLNKKRRHLFSLDIFSKIINFRVETVSLLHCYTTSSVFLLGV